ncbi:hypothetical protein FCM35_KLT12557 [Carex littledalei]|uniref:Small ribosomal subunit protein mS23 n=1 Tax=Carex littledalei TaxID=544730 RepID=A0A833QN68_9POAL|nr:hypothetical protein FCM35_KLT12557 [Carex littledalei]
MSFMRGDLLTRVRKLVKGYAMPTPPWLKAMEKAPPVTFPRPDAKIEKIKLPEDDYVMKFLDYHDHSMYHDAIRLSDFDPPPARIFAWRVLELMEQGVGEEEAVEVADMEYLAEKKAKMKAYKELKAICKLRGKRPPENPYPSAVREIQREERKFVNERFSNPKILQIVQKMKEERYEQRREREEAAGIAGGGRGGFSLGGGGYGGGGGGFGRGGGGYGGGGYGGGGGGFGRGGGGYGGGGAPGRYQGGGGGGFGQFR